jgi:ribosomal protein L1
MDEQQQQKMREAVDRKAKEAEEASRVQANVRQTTDPAREQGDIDPRTKNSRHGQVTADKWNQ